MRRNPVHTLYVDRLFIQNCCAETHSVTTYNRAAIQQLSAFWGKRSRFYETPILGENILDEPPCMYYE
jgi:hypothetical protein